MENFEYSFEKLTVWKSARQFVAAVYKLLSAFPAQERYGLCDQIRRAVISIPSNIAEGSGRVSYKEKIHFIEIAYGSLMEVHCQLQLSEDLGYITKEQMTSLKAQSMEIAKMLTGLRYSFQQKLNNL